MHMNGYMKMGSLTALFFWPSFSKFTFRFVWFRVEVTLKISTAAGPENEKTVHTAILILTQIHEYSIKLHVK